MQKAIFESSSNEVIKMTKLSGVLFTQWYHKNGNLKCCEKNYTGEKKRNFSKIGCFRKISINQNIFKKEEI